jgi:hypothetical protein
MIYLSLFYCFMILFKYNNIVILDLVTFYLNLNQCINLYRYKIF